MVSSLIRAWRLRRLAARQASYVYAADHYRNEARRLALLAYEVPDMMAEPLKWGRLQNAANWAKHHERTFRAKEREISALIARHKGA